MLTLIDTQSFTADGTWTKPGLATYVDVMLIAGGGGGGSGSCGPASTNRLGGAGGSAGSIIYIKDIPEAYLGATESVVVGAGGAGGAGVLSSNNGNAGSIGGDTRFSYFQASGGFYGQGGLNNESSMDKIKYPLDTSCGLLNFNAAAFTIPFRDNLNLATLTNSQAMFEQGSVSDTSRANRTTNFTGYTLQNEYGAPTAGTPGGCINNSDVTTPNSTFNVLNQDYSDLSFPAVLDVPTLPYDPVFIQGSATDGNNGETYALYFGSGATGGYSNTSGDGYDGGIGGSYGGGGGGGGASVAGNTSGAGGAGGAGYAIIFSYSGSPE